MTSSRKLIELSLVLPCFNEMEHIAKSLPAIESLLASVFGEGHYEILLIDDGSTDGTREWLAGLDGNVRVLMHEKNRGRGAAVKSGLTLAQGECVGFMDIDREISESYIPRFRAAIQGGADLVVGHRIYRMEPTLRDGVRKLCSISYRRLVRGTLQLSVADTEAGYKFFSRRAVQLILERSQFDGWFWDTESVAVCTEGGLDVREIEVVYRRLAEKTSTVRVARDSIAYLKCLAQFRARRG